MPLRFPDARRILIIKPSSLGDIVHALPILAAVRDAYPKAHIAWLVGTSFRALLDGHPLLDEVIPFDRKHYGRMLSSPRSLLDFLGFCRALRRRRFDLVLDLQGLFRSGFLAWISGARRRVGFAQARELARCFYTVRVRCEAPPRAGAAPTTDLHAVDRNIKLARAIGLEIEQPAFPLNIDDALHAAAAQRLAAAGVSAGEFVAVLPGARWESKRWAAESWAALIDALQQRNAPRVVLLGGPDERDLAASIVAAARGPVANLVGQTSLRELAAILARAKRVICCDSGPMHIAAALNRPLVALFGPTNPARTGPYSPRATVVRLPLTCSPCYARHCPLGHHDCMKKLDVERVLAATAD